MTINIKLGKASADLNISIIASHSQLLKKLEELSKDTTLTDSLYTQVQQQLVLTDENVISNLGDLYEPLCSKLEAMLSNEDINNIAKVEAELDEFIGSAEIKAILSRRRGDTNGNPAVITMATDISSSILAEFYALKPQILWFFNIRLNGHEPHDASLELFFTVDDLGVLSCANNLKVTNSKVLHPIAFSVPLPTRTLAALQSSRVFTKGAFEISESIDVVDDTVEGTNDLFTNAVDSLVKDIVENSAAPASTSYLEPIHFNTLTLHEVARGKMSFNAKVDKFLSFKRISPMRAVSLQDDLNSDASFLIDYICPPYLHPEVGSRRIEAFRKLLVDRSILDNLIARIVDKKILRGRTQFGHNIVALSEVITSINEILSSVGATTRPLVAIPLLYIVLAEFKRTGLIREDINIMFLTPEVKPVAANFHHLQTSILRGELRAHIQAFLKSLNSAEYKGTVLPDALKMEIYKRRLRLYQDFDAIDITSKVFERVLTYTAVRVRDIRPEVFTMNPQLIDHSVTQTLASIYEVAREVITNDAYIIQAFDVTEAQTVREDLDWIMLRIGEVTDLLCDLKDLTDTLVYSITNANNQGPAGVLLSLEEDTKNMLISRWTRYSGTNTISMKLRDRESLEKRLVAGGNFTFKSLAGTVLDSLLSEACNAALPNYCYFSNLTPIKAEALNAALNGGFIFYCASDVITEFTSNTASGVTSFEKNIPSNCDLYFPVPVEAVKIPNLSHVSSELRLTDPISALIYKLTDLDKKATWKCSWVESNLKPRSMGESFHYFNAGVNSQNSLQKTYEWKGTVLGNKIQLRIALADLYRFEPVKNSVKIQLDSSIREASTILGLDLWLSELRGSNLKSTALQYSHAFETFRTIFASNPEVRHIAINIADRWKRAQLVQIGQPFTDFDAVTMRLVNNHAIAMAAYILNDICQIVAKPLIETLISRAAKSSDWTYKDLMS